MAASVLMVEELPKDLVVADMPGGEDSAALGAGSLLVLVADILVVETAVAGEASIAAADAPAVAVSLDMAEKDSLKAQGP